MSLATENLAAKPEDDAPGATASEHALAESAEWYAQLAGASVPESEHLAFERWLRADTDHLRAWRELQTTWDALESARRPAARVALEQTYREERRQLRRLLPRGSGVLLLLLAALPAAWLGLGMDAPGHLLADHYTAIGERRSIELADGSRLTLDTATAVDVAYTDGLRRIRLRDGRLFVDVAPDPDRPLEVITDEARARALGTRFSVRRLREGRARATRVSVYESRVELCPAASGGDCQRLQGGERAAATNGRVGPVTALAANMQPAWVRGQLQVEDRPVSEVLAELARYHRGLLRYDAGALAGLRVSGVLPLEDTDRALKALAASVPLRIQRYTPWVIRVSRADQ